MLTTSVRKRREVETCRKGYAMLVEKKGMYMVGKYAPKDILYARLVVLQERPAHYVGRH